MECKRCFTHLRLTKLIVTKFDVGTRQIEVFKIIHQSSVDLSAPTILRPWVRPPEQTISNLNLYLNCDEKRTKINKKSPGLTQINKVFRKIRLTNAKLLFKQTLEQENGAFKYYNEPSPVPFIDIQFSNKIISLQTYMKTS